ncbi:MAG: DUF4294 domain-containing protein [Bacteroidota bacterium]|nr:DUF4294 domain-containing protein [Bacteroidota bacterium]MDP4249135.1 DUF4294 domain-containing protein [Bacteroidota bacterium]
MRAICLIYFYRLIPFILLITVQPVFAQQPPAPSAATPSRQTPDSRFGKNDTIYSMVVVYDGDTIPAKTLELVNVTGKMTRAQRKRWEAMTRLRNAVYVTYPYARKAGIILNDMNAKLAKMQSPEEKKGYIKSREKDLKKEFTDPMESLSIYQGKVLMKLINRQTGNNCYDIIKEYRGGFTARFWQTVAFFFGSSLKQPYDAHGDDKDIESIVQEVERMYRG